MNGRAEVFRTIAAAVGRHKDLQLVLSIGNQLDSKQIGPVSSNTIVVQQAPQTKHVGNWFLDNAEDAPPSVFFVRHSSSIKFTMNDDATKVVSSVELPKRGAVALTGKKTTIGGVTYEEAAGGFWVLSSPLVAGQPQIPADLGANEKWIDVDLTRQTLIAFEGKKPVFATLISSGRRNKEDKEHDFPTPTGTFRIGEKHITTTMDGDVASDGPYSIEDVPWVMYFENSFALHGAFWHNSFGSVHANNVRASSGARFTQPWLRT